MSEELLLQVEKIYFSSGLPTAITDKNLNVIRRNPPAESNRSPLKRSNLSEFFENGVPAAGMVCFAENKNIHRFNVLDFGDFFVAEHIGSDELKTLLLSPDVKAYVTYICSKIRESVGMIAVSADEINSAAAALSSESSEITGNLNTIDNALMIILREIINPEQLYLTLDPGSGSATICVENILSKSAADCRRILGKKTKVSLQAEKGVFIRINRGVFETIISDMAAECCNGTLFPEELIFSCERSAPDRAAITVRSVNRSGKKNSVPLRSETGSKGKNIYSGYLCSVMCEKYGAVFTEHELEDGYSCRMETEVLFSAGTVVMDRPKFQSVPERFSAMALALSEYRSEERYGGSSE